MNKKIKDDFYEYINEQWLKTAKIPDDRSSIGSFVEMDLELEKLLKGLVSKWHQDNSSIPNDPLIHEYVKFYSMILNTKKRDELGWEPVRNFLSKIENLKNFSQIQNANKDFWINYNFLPFSLSIDEDFANSERRIVWISEDSTILPSTKTYENQEEKERLLTVWKNMVKELLLSYGKNEQESEKIIQNSIQFDELYKNYVLTPEEAADYVSLYNLKQRNEVNKYSKNFNFLEIIDRFVGQEVTEVSILNERFFKNFDLIFSEENFEKYKDLLFVKNLLSTTTFLTEQIREVANKFSKAVTSIEKTRTLEDFAYDKTNTFFSMPLGMFYAKEYFGENSKKNIEHMIENMVKVYTKRLSENDWLSKETIEKAIAKISKLKFMIGYPEIIRPYYNKFKVLGYEQGGNLFTNALKFSEEISKYKISLYHKDEDKRYWSMSPAQINAYYHPIKNQMVFPAAILNFPFYKYDRCSSANYGGIGAVIAHEISHAFDNNGSQFDENGQLNNWWTEKDKSEFLKRTEAVIKLYDQRETEFGKVNGKLTVSENIADLGGFECALEAAKMEKDFNPEELFKSWATIWRSIYREGAAKRQLETDVHSPTKIRANVVLANNELFAQTYEITENDKMYIPKENKVKIW
ncbi:M13 family metallopeptidase [Mesomycoplasma lagogenitalium]|uniref:M13 family metallopeptidase n=1 Tax=Mesomycoplasma lagogenitalium TaxID=171286 RepID=A0ABY8LTU7_9BACT|nr:M13 family metallopeptidase [Mesomycoplasma lagogenitalium]WGI36664.1 M13 family metallopeptidase [Mesomycoplasma lagogenitalium]